MNGQTNQDTAAAKTPDGGINLRGRTPAEIAEQLLRDATSLTLTGASFEKDKRFYDQVAANVREAAQFLSQWQHLVDALQRTAEHREYGAHLAAFSKAEEIAATVAHLVPEASAFRHGAGAVHNAIRAYRESWVMPQAMNGGANQVIGTGKSPINLIETLHTGGVRK